MKREVLLNVIGITISLILIVALYSNNILIKDKGTLIAFTASVGALLGANVQSLINSYT